MASEASDEAATEAVEKRAELRNPGYEIFIALLSILSIVNLVLLVLVRQQDLQYVLAMINIPITVIFFIDFLYRLRIAPSKSDYFWRNWGWADLLASLPFQETKILRLFRLVKVARLLRDYGGRNVVRSLMRDKAGSALLMLLFVAILVLEFGSLLLLSIEADAPGANITTASDAIWYTIVTMSTVGYGDTYPVTNPGRIVGTGIIIVGVGVFGTLTGYLANLFLTPSKKKADAPAPTDVQARLAALQALAAQQQQAIADLQEVIDRDRGGR